MADGKWIDGLAPDMPLHSAARHTLDIRLGVVREYLLTAVHEADGDPENVHQLRVGTRRADAALRIFADCLSKKVYRKARQRLKRIRRAAGAARDWDVFLSDLLEREQKADAKHRGGLDFLIGYALGQRAASHAELEAVYHEEGPTFETFLVNTVDSVQPPDGQSASAILVDLARPMLFDRLKELEQ